MIATAAEVRVWFPQEASPETAAEYTAADAYVDTRTTWPGKDTGTPAPDELKLAVRILTARYLARRNSPDGIVGMADFGVVHISTVDRDVRSLMAPYRKVVLA